MRSISETVTGHCMRKGRFSLIISPSASGPLSVREGGREGGSEGRREGGKKETKGRREGGGGREWKEVVNGSESIQRGVRGRVQKKGKE